MASTTNATLNTNKNMENLVEEELEIIKLGNTLSKETNPYGIENKHLNGLWWDCDACGGDSDSGCQSTTGECYR